MKRLLDSDIELAVPRSVSHSFCSERWSKKKGKQFTAWVCVLVLGVGVLFLCM